MPTPPAAAPAAERGPTPPAGTPGEVLGVFLKLGLTSFGGPIAHLGYYRDELVVHRRWIDEAGFADLVALCQFLPGPASSQVGFALGLLRGGPLGALAAWAAFTLPSAALLLAFAAGLPAIAGPLGEGLIHGLKLAAVAVIAQAVWGMAQALAPDRPRAALALAALMIVTALPGSFGQIAAIALGAAAGTVLCQDAAAATSHAPLAFPISRRAGIALLALFAVLLVGLPALVQAGAGHGAALFSAFYRTGALVFGGGHVVLPLLEAETVRTGWVSRDAFLAGYGAAQAVPGPIFSFTAYLGAVAGPAPNGIFGALLALIAIFLPGLLLVAGTLPFWAELRTRKAARAAMAGANAAVVGVLAGALYDPVWTGAVLAPFDFVLAAGGFVLLTVWRAPSFLVVALCAIGGLALRALA